MADRKLIDFPSPQLEKYEILYDPMTHTVDIPLIPDEVFPAVCILVKLMRMLVEEGTLTAGEILKISTEATGRPQ